MMSAAVACMLAKLYVSRTLTYASSTLRLPELRFRNCSERMHWISAALLLASLLIGLAHVAALPPFEGADETAHYSYIEQIAKTGTFPRFGDKLRQDALDVE